MGRARVLTGCRDCRNCTNSAAAHGARKAGRTAAAWGTLGLSEVGMGLAGKCRACGHQMSLHGEARAPQPFVQQLPAAPAVQGPPPGWYVDPQGSGGQRWWDGRQWTVLQPAPAAPQLPPAPVTPAAGWYPNPAGQGGQRYWDGARWTEHTAP